MSNRNDGAFLFLIAIPVLAFVAFCFWLARSIGADTGVTATACLITLVIGVLVLGSKSLLGWFPGTAIPLLLFLTVSYYNWWDVLDNIAVNKDNVEVSSNSWGVTQTSPLTQRSKLFDDVEPEVPEFWFNSWWIKYGGEAALIIALIYAWSSSNRRY